MRRFAAFALVLLTVGFAPWLNAAAQESDPNDQQSTPDERSVGGRKVGLGAYGGGNFPVGNRFKYETTEAWGFQVDIPVISVFYITPQAQLYRLVQKKFDPKTNRVSYDATGVTDLSTNFKFIVPVNQWRLYFAAVMGLSNGRFDKNDPIVPHMGFQFGFGYRVFSNVDFFAQGQYRLLINASEGNLNMIQAIGGFSYSF